MSHQKARSLKNSDNEERREQGNLSGSSDSDNEMEQVDFTA